MNRVIAPTVRVVWQKRESFVVMERPNAVLFFILIHVPIALLMYHMSSVATFHAIATLMVGLAWAVSKRKTMLDVACMGAYIMGAEVLWRMTEANVFWEYGKYATAAVFLVALLSRKQTNKPALAFIYFLLLLPSAVFTATSLPLNQARMAISFNLSGPFSLMVCSWFFANLELTREDLHRLWRTALGPMIGIASIALYSTLTASEIHFTDESNFTTSGGFGPNQVASALGLGALFALLYLLTEEKHKCLKATMFALMLFLASQSALTFSRGGVWIAAISGLVVFLYLIRDKRTRFRVLSVAGLLFVVGQYVVIPQLDAFTGGALSERFRNLSPTNRERFVRADLAIFAEHPFLGVGPGMAFFHRGMIIGVRSSAHTEITRLLAEHGMFGLMALLLLLIMGWQNFQRGHSVQSRAIVAGMVVWSLVYMLGNAMRTVSPSFCFGLSFAKFNWEESDLSKGRVNAQPKISDVNSVHIS